VCLEYSVVLFFILLGQIMDALYVTQPAGGVSEDGIGGSFGERARFNSKQTNKKKTGKKKPRRRWLKATRA